MCERIEVLYLLLAITWGFAVVMWARTIHLRGKLAILQRREHRANLLLLKAHTWLFGHGERAPTEIGKDILAHLEDGEHHG